MLVCFIYSNNRKIYSNETVKIDRSKIPKPYACSKCSKKFAQRHRLRYHEKAHTDPYECKECKRTFELHSLFQIHMQRHSGTLKYKCDICNRRFGQESLLNNHVKRHSSNLNAVCAECGKGYTTKDGLRYHMKSHTENKKYVCVYCKEGFFYKSKCKEHEASHLQNADEIKSFHFCEECKSDIPLNKYKDHLKKHTKYVCRICGMSFNMLKLCREHEITHANGESSLTKPKNIQIPKENHSQKSAQDAILFSSSISQTNKNQDSQYQSIDKLNSTISYTNNREQLQIMSTPLHTHTQNYTTLYLNAQQY